MKNEKSASLLAAIGQVNTQKNKDHAEGSHGSDGFGEKEGTGSHGGNGIEVDVVGRAECIHRADI